MSEYVPDTEEVRGCLVELPWYGLTEEEFDRWLAKVKAEAWDRAESAAWDAHKRDHHEPWSHMPNNPYRNGEDQ